MGTRRLDRLRLGELETKKLKALDATIASSNLKPTHISLSDVASDSTNSDMSVTVPSEPYSEQLEDHMAFLSDSVEELELTPEVPDIREGLDLLRKKQNLLGVSNQADHKPSPRALRLMRCMQGQILTRDEEMPDIPETTPRSARSPEGFP